MANSKKKNVKEMSYAELVAERNDMKQKYMDLRFQKRTMRRQIATLNTLIRAKELAGQTK